MGCFGSGGVGIMNPLALSEESIREFTALARSVAADAKRQYVQILIDANSRTREPMGMSRLIAIAEHCWRNR